jgi:hypothetical protein
MIGAPYSLAAMALLVFIILVPFGTLLGIWLGSVSSDPKPHPRQTHGDEPAHAQGAVSNREIMVFSQEKQSCTMLRESKACTNFVSDGHKLYNVEFAPSCAELCGTVLCCTGG